MRLKPISTLKADLGINPGGKVQKFFTDTCAKHMDKYVPKEKGVLRDTVVKDGETTSNVTSNTITYAQEYAHAQYTGIVNGSPVTNYTTPGTGPYWDKRMKSAEMQIVVKEVQDYVLKKGNN